MRAAPPKAPALSTLTLLTICAIALAGCLDRDDDGVRGSDDCDPTDGAIAPGLYEIPWDGVDNDCDPSTPDDDLDGDGYGVAWDCDESDPAVHPDAEEVCDGIDNDCSGQIDDGLGETWYVDGDGDGWGGASVTDCTGGRYVAEGGDCDDADRAVYPQATEDCDGLDDDCDGAVDEDPALMGVASLCPAESCAAILAERAELSDGSGDGIWWLDPDGAGAFEAWCDLSGGGWTLAASLLNDDGSTWTIADWTAAAGFGSAADHRYGDYKGDAFWRLPATALRAVDSADNWLAFEGALSGTLAQALSDPTCASAPLSGVTASSSDPEAEVALLALWASDPEGDLCPLEDDPADAAAIATFQDGCGAWGFGQTWSDGTASDHAFCLEDGVTTDGACGPWFGFTGLTLPEPADCGVATLWVR